MSVPTPHNEAKIGDIADTVLMPGDPLRAKYIADNFLDSVVCYNKVRGMYGFTGYYKGKRISVQGSGMGVPSMGIYSYELFNYYNVKNIIRIGSAGALSNEKSSKEARGVNLGDILVASQVDSDSNYLTSLNKPDKIIPLVSDELLKKVEQASLNTNIDIKIGKIFTSDVFYSSIDNLIEISKKDVIGVEMETFALYVNAKIANKNAIAIYTVSDNIIKGESISSSERQNGFDKMIKLALDTAINC